MSEHHELESRIILRTLRLEDYEQFTEAMRAAYADSSLTIWPQAPFERLLHDFPEGQLCIEMDGRVVGAALSLGVRYSRFGDNHTYRQITGNYRLDTHDKNGDVLYGIEVFIDPVCRGLRLGRRLYDGRKELCENLNLRGIVGGGRIPNYLKHANRLTPKEYIEKVKKHELYDPILTFQLSNDFHVKKVLRGYLPNDEQSQEYAVLLEWNNIYYQEKNVLINRKKPVVRLGLIQWQMRRTQNIEELYEQLEFFIDAVSGHQTDFILLPEFFNAPLMAKFNNLGEAQAIRSVAQFTKPLRAKLMELAVSYNVNIIAGSMPLVDGEGLFSITYLCRRDGSYDSYRKIHILPGESRAWGMLGGSELRAMETDAGTIGILSAYDVQFPELARLYAEQGAEILFVPFQADTPNGYQRVRSCARARAVENECYVAIAGAVGNLPRVQNMDVQYAQSAVFSPSDFQFPINGIISEATPNTEMTLVADVNLDLLKEVHGEGTARNLTDRRTDLFEVRWLAKD